MWQLLVFAVTGLLAGATARLWYPGREPLRILGTMVLGMAGAVVGGMLSWAVWPAPEDGPLQAGALLMALLGAVAGLALWPCVAYARRARTTTAPVASPPLLAAAPPTWPNTKDPAQRPT